MKITLMVGGLVAAAALSGTSLVGDKAAIGDVVAAPTAAPRTPLSPEAAHHRARSAGHDLAYAGHLGKGLAGARR